MNIFRSRPSSFFAIILSIVVLGLLCAVLSQQVGIAGTSRNITEQKQMLSKAHRQLKDIAACQNDYVTCSRKLGGTMQSCSWDEQAPFMIGQITGIVEPLGVKVQALQPEEMTSDKKILRFPMRIRLQCKLKPLVQILAGIKETKPCLLIERLDIRKAKDGNEILQADMTVVSFVVIDPESLVEKRRLVAETSRTIEELKEKAEAAE